VRYRKLGGWRVDENTEILGPVRLRQRSCVPCKLRFACTGGAQSMHSTPFARADRSFQPPGRMTTTVGEDTPMHVTSLPFSLDACMLPMVFHSFFVLTIANGQTLQKPYSTSNLINSKTTTCGLPVVLEEGGEKRQHCCRVSHSLRNINLQLDHRATRQHGLFHTIYSKCRGRKVHDSNIDLFRQPGKCSTRCGVDQ